MSCPEGELNHRTLKISLKRSLLPSDLSRSGISPPLSPHTPTPWFSGHNLIFSLPWQALISSLPLASSATSEPFTSFARGKTRQQVPQARAPPWKGGGEACEYHISCHLNQRREWRLCDQGQLEGAKLEPLPNLIHRQCPLSGPWPP